MRFSVSIVAEGDREVQLAALNFQAGIQIANDLHPGLVGLPRAPYAPLPLAFAVAKGRNANLLRRFNVALAPGTAQ